MGSLAGEMICNEELELFDLSNNVTINFLESLINFSNNYGEIHKYLTLIICIVGVFMNMIHVLVLTTKNMYKSTVNRLLCFIAICDIITMVDYGIYNLRFNFMEGDLPQIGYELKWIAFLLGHVVLSIGLHSITLYLSVGTAYIRYKALDKLDSKLMNKNVAGPIFLIVSISIILLCIPTFFVHSIVQIEGSDDQILYTVSIAESSVFNSCFAFKLNLWLTGICFKVIPCILLIFFTCALLYKMDTTRQKRRLITSGSSLATKRNDAHSDRTTKMLIILMMIFLCTELPQGILAVLNGLWPNDIHQYVYLSLGDVLDLLSLINSNSCYLVYPLISTQYRHTLRSMVQCFRNKYRSRLNSANHRLTLHGGDTSTIRFMDDRDVLL